MIEPACSWKYIHDQIVHMTEPLQYTSGYWVHLPPPWGYRTFSQYNSMYLKNQWGAGSKQIHGKTRSNLITTSLIFTSFRSHILTSPYWILIIPKGFIWMLSRLTYPYFIKFSLVLGIFLTKVLSLWKMYWWGFLDSSVLYYSFWIVHSVFQYYLKIN